MTPHFNISNKYRKVNPKGAMRNMKKGTNIWCLIVILAVVGSVLSGMAGAANKSANLTGDTTNVTEETNNVTNATISNSNETILDNTSSINVSAEGADNDEDGIDDYEEWAGHISKLDGKTYFTDNTSESTDRDPYDDGQEVDGHSPAGLGDFGGQMPASIKAPGNHPLVPSYPDLKVELEGIEVIPKCKITSTETKEEGKSWILTTETLDWTRTDWGIGGGFSLIPFSIGVKGYRSSEHESYTHTLNSTSGWSREEWSVATAIEPDKAAKLKFHIRIKNDGTDLAENVWLIFNVKIGDKPIKTVWTKDKPIPLIASGEVFPDPIYSPWVIDSDVDGKEIVVTLDELKSIELGAPISIEVPTITADVPWGGKYKHWLPYIEDIEAVSARLMVDFGDGEVSDYMVWSGIRKTMYISNISLKDAIDKTIGIEERDGVYIGTAPYVNKPVKLENWTFGFDNETFQQINETLPENWTLYDLLNVTIKQGWVIVMKAPDIKPPEIHWASYSRDMKTIRAGVSDNENIAEVIAHVKVGEKYEDVELRDKDGDLMYEATLLEKITDTEADYIITSDGKFNTTWAGIPRITKTWTVDDDKKECPDADFTRVQDAINNESVVDGDTVLVYPGVYCENVVVNKSIALEGEDKNTTIIDGYGYDAINISANNVRISDFEVRNGYDGINVYSNNNLIENCIISNNSDDGIQLGSDGYENGLKTVVREWNTNYTGSGRYADNLQEFEDSFANEEIIGRGIVDRVDFHGKAPITGTEDHFSIEYIGYIYCSENGTYTFATDSDDASVLLIDDKEVASWYGDHVMEHGWSHKGNIYITKGYHKFRFLMQEWEGKTGASAGWKRPSYTSTYIIPSSYLYHKTAHGTPIGNNITNCKIHYNEGDGIYFWKSADNILEGNNVSNNEDDGIQLSYSSNNTVLSNDVLNNFEGIYLYESSHNKISSNNISNNSYGIFLFCSPNNIITKNSIFKNEYTGIFLCDSSYNTLSNNIINSNSGEGIYLLHFGFLPPPFPSKKKEDMEGFSYSINITHIPTPTPIVTPTAQSPPPPPPIGPTHNLVSNNTVSNNGGNGIVLIYSSDNTISNNNVSDNGLVVTPVLNTTVKNREVSDDSERVAAIEDENGIYLYESSNNSVINNSILNNWDNGIYLCHPQNNSITNNIISNNYEDGIYLYNSSDNILSNNLVQGNADGIELYKSKDNIITNNNVTLNRYEGIEININSSNNIIKDNTVSRNNDEGGIDLDSGANNNLIYHNNLINNTRNAEDDGYKNLWHNGYPSGGNYWDDHICEGNPSNGSQPYYIPGSANAVDWFPFQDPNGWLPKLPKTIYVDDDFVDNPTEHKWDTIQEGINDANNGDTVIVYSGLYVENVVVDKSINITGIGYPVVDAGGSGSAITLSANGITLEGFKATNSESSWGNAGIKVISNRNTITGDNATYNGYGILLSSSSDNTITENNASNNDFNGIWLSSSSNNTITGNVANNNGHDGIFLVSSSSNNTITDNSANNNGWNGIYLFDSSDNNVITGNTVSNNNGTGILLGHSNNNTITGNNATNNAYGIKFYYYSNDSKIYLNNFLNNTDSVDSSDATNIWNSTSKITYTYNENTYTNYMGNYWDDYKEKYPDAEEIDESGIWDTPYSIDSDNGTYPLVEPWENYFEPTEDWPMFCHDVRHTGYSSSKAPDTDNILWTFQTGGWVESSIAVLNGVLYVGSNDGNLYAIDATTGNFKWNFTIGGKISSSPAICDGTVYLQSNLQDKNIYAIDSDTGALKWKFKTEMAIDDVASSPVVVDGTVYVGSSDYSESLGGSVYALDACTGDLKWAFTNKSDTFVSSPAVSGGTVYVGSTSGTLYALDKDTGAILWEFNAGTGLGNMRSSPAVSNGVVYISCQYFRGINKIYAVNALNGALKWEFSTESDGPEYSSPAIYNDIVYVGSDDGYIYALNANTGELKWKYKTGYCIYSSPAISSDGMVLIGSYDGNIYALDANTGDLKWKYRTGGWIFSSPAIADKKVFVGSKDGKIYCFGTPTPSFIFDTGPGTYPSIFGAHNGTITPNVTIEISKLYTYPCEGTGGHTDYAEIRNATWNATAIWEGYVDDWHNITFDKTVVLLANETYNYTIHTGSYPQIHHTSALLTANGWINCTEFVDANGKKYNDWIPAIRLWRE